ncbi:polysaccharide biosynthesis tyrosine autokinase [bacterium]|nr:polysaccharide biosynthesis tyrosine autokinase [bacterium]
MNQYLEELEGLGAAPAESEGGIDFGKFLRGFWRRKWILLAFTAIGAAVFYSIARNDVPIYSTNLTIQARAFDPDAERLMERDRLIAMKSRTFYEQLTAKLGLALSLSEGSVWDNAIFSEFWTTTTPTPGKYRLRIDDGGRFFLYFISVDNRETAIDSCSVWDVVDRSRSVYGFTFSLRPDFVATNKEKTFKIKEFNRAISELVNSVKVEFNTKSGLMILTMIGTDYETLPLRLNRIAEIYRQESLGLKDRDMDRGRKNLEMKKDAAERSLKEAEASLRAFQERYPLSLERERMNIGNQLDAINQELKELPIQRDKISQLLERLSAPGPGIDPNQFRQFIVTELCNCAPLNQEPYLRVLHAQLTQQLQDMKTLAGQYAADSQVLKDQQAKINQTQEDIIAFSSKFRSTLAEREKAAREKLSLVLSQQRQLPADENTLAELQRRKKICEENYDNLLKELGRIDLAGHVEGEDVTILDPASRPTSAGTSRAKKIALGAGLGLMLGLMLSVGLDWADKTIRSAEDIQQALNLPVLGVIPVVDFKDIPEYHDFEKAKHIDRQLVTHDYSPTPIGEAYRALRTQILFSKKRERIQTLVITSVGPEDGKSFTSSNLAIIFAQQRTNTLLVDADLRRGVLHNTFRMRKEPGLANYLNGSITLTEAVQATHIPNLSFISYGTLMPNPSELLGSLQMQRFLNEVKRKFDLILFDSPPLEAATDAVVIGTQVDGVALVVRSGRTHRDLAKEKLEIFSSVPANLIGVILNGGDSVLAQNYSYYHY